MLEKDAGDFVYIECDMPGNYTVKLHIGQLANMLLDKMAGQASKGKEDLMRLAFTKYGENEKGLEKFIVEMASFPPAMEE